MTDFPLSTIVTAARKSNSNRRLPIGVGLTIGAGASLGLWVAIGFSLRALLT